MWASSVCWLCEIKDSIPPPPLGGEDEMLHSWFFPSYMETLSYFGVLLFKVKKLHFRVRLAFCTSKREKGVSSSWMKLLCLGYKLCHCLTMYPCADVTNIETFTNCSCFKCWKLLALLFVTKRQFAFYYHYKNKLLLKKDNCVHLRIS